MSRIADKNTTNYRYYDTEDGRRVLKDLYDGECHFDYVGRSVIKDRDRREPTYWYKDIAYTLERTHKLALDRPTVTISIPVEHLGIGCLTIAAADYCLRAITPYFERINAGYANRSRPDRDNGKFILYDPGPVVLARNAAYFAEIPAKDYEEISGNAILVDPDKEPEPDRMCLCIRMEVQLPYLKLERAKTMLCKQLPDATMRFVKGFDMKAFDEACKLAETQQAIRDFLAEGEYCAFIANGSILARERGSNAPMINALPFQSPLDDEITISGIKGMGVKRGVTVITGGGYSGKSTVLAAISAGIYNHVANDGRELCITDMSAVTITAEDGRAVSCLNISPFIKWIPGGDARVFSTSHASGSTSQAANIMEAIDCGAKLLLIDEDRSATNFMIRDATMKELIEKEPITPFTDRVQELAAMGISTILVIGGSGEYLSVADKIYMMDDFVMGDATDKARALVCRNMHSSKQQPAKVPGHEHVKVSKTHWQTSRHFIDSSLSSYPVGSGREKLAVSDTGFIMLGDERIDIRNLHDITTPAQVNALAFMLRHLTKAHENISDIEALALSMRGLDRKAKTGSKIKIARWVDELFTQIEKDGLNLVDTGFFATMERFMDLPRPFEVVAAINRMRLVEWKAD